MSGPAGNPVATSLYRHFASDGTLLYVGISLSWPARTKQHAHGSRWFEQVAKVDIERFPNREAALEAEREAIKREKPKFNVVHNRGSSAKAHRKNTKWRVAETAGRLRPQLAKDMGRLLKYPGPLPVAGITGPKALVGPALVYSGNKISVFVAWGTSGTAGQLTEIVLGNYIPERDAWTDACASVVILARAGDITMSQAQDMRACIIRNLRWDLRPVAVETFDDDVELARAYAQQFPGEQSRRILRDILAEKALA